MAWTSLSYSFGSLLTSAKMTQLYDNLTAMANGDAGAPLIQAAAIDTGAVGQAEIANSAVGQGELKTTTASGSTAIADDADAAVTLTGGTYAWWTAGASPSGNQGILFGHSNTAAGTLGLANISGSLSITFYRDERYIQASPPYDMGDGEIPLFIYALINNSTGEIESLEVGRDPTWAYHGPTIITPTRMTKDKKFRDEFIIGSSGLTVAQARDQNPALFKEWLEGKQQAVKREIEITKEYKNSDMNTHAHPWIYNKPEYFIGKTIVMIDPFDPMMQKFYELQQSEHARIVRDMIQESFKVKSGEIANRAKPNGIAIHRLKLKGT